MTKSAIISAAVFFVVVVGRPSAAAQAAGSPRAPFGPVDPRAGDCVVTVNVPAEADISRLAIYLDGKLLTVGPARRRGATARMKLRDPLHENDTLTATLSDGRSESASEPQLVRQARQAEDPPNESCQEKLLPDDRGVFEASGYLGRAFDNFAPAGGNQYIKPPAEPGVQSRFLAGVEAQYRLFGDKGHTFQVWLETYTLHGVRSSDVDCRDGKSDPICDGTTQQRFLAILEHQSSLEAHLDVRVEFATLQKKSEMPIKAYTLARFGFVGVQGAPRVYNNDSFGVGILSPSGVFKGSSAQIAWGQSEQFQSNPGWNRMKMSGMLLFDLVPGFADSVQFWKRLGGSPRAFISIAVDRNPRGPGPDTVTSYVGVDVDLRRLFFGFGG